MEPPGSRRYRGSIPTKLCISSACAWQHGTILGRAVDQRAEGKLLRGQPCCGSSKSEASSGQTAQSPAAAWSETPNCPVRSIHSGRKRGKLAIAKHSLQLIFSSKRSHLQCSGL